MNSALHQRILSLIVSFAMFMEGLDSSVINTAIPTIASSLQVNPIDLKIALISYLLSLAIFIPISGWVADKFGIRRVFMTALIIFTLSSLWCGFARNLPELVLARVFQGIGGSFMLPVGRLIIIRTFPRSEFISRMNQVVMIAAFGIMLGPVLGGFITHYLSWPWIFFVNVPIGCLAIALAYGFLDAKETQKVARLDKLGFIVFGYSLAAFTFGLSAFSETYINNRTALLIILSAILSFAFYLWHSRQEKNPVVNPTLFSLRTFRISSAGNLLSRLSFGGVPFLVPLLLQVAFGYSAQISGLLLAPTAMGMLLAKPILLRLLRTFGYKWLLIFTNLLLGLTLATFSLVTINTPLWHIAILMLVFGFLASLQYTSMNSLSLAEASTENFSSVTSILSTIQQLAQSFGVAVSALFIRIFSEGSGREISLTTQTLHHTFIALGVITTFSIFIFVKLKANDGQQLIQRKS